MVLKVFCVIRDCNYVWFEIGWEWEGNLQNDL